jgi:UDPglucose--hexose-1-phosphate uridylyltransferase
MPEYRQDPLSRRWVIIGSDRAGRPNEFVEATTRHTAQPCPFCAGHETETPPAIATYDAGLGGPWSVRVVPNKFPAVLAEEVPPFPGAALESQSEGHPLPGFGKHEVIIETPRHVASFSELTPAEATLVLRAYRDRLRILKADGRFRYVQIFKNVGAAAGASLEHVHSQLIALPGVPEVIRQELQSSLDFFQTRQKSLLESMIDSELDADLRVVAATSRYVAWCPAASRFPYETWLAPRFAQANFENGEDGELGELAGIARDVIDRIERATGVSTYNYYLHTAPFDRSAPEHYHWHFEIAPRLTKVAGFEWGTGCYINPCPPETAAAHLRGAANR